uniref:Laccase n=1 Tax=Pleurotus salmoneostramineus TaxID=64638 RepID=D2KZ04_9AGAR|nr:laccase [Pleurotus salmoneostramineus]
MITQCPITPGSSFLYEFAATEQAGTFWYHSHLQAQYCDGLRGPFIVYDPEDPHADLYDVDDESTILTLGDWYHLPSPEIHSKPTSDSTLINGKGRSVGNSTVPLHVLEVQQGQRYRIRLLNVACDPFFDFHIDGHPFTIIEVDGENTEPLVVDSIRIFAGQRYSIVINANQTVNNYWIRANPNNETAFSGFDNGRNSAILRYVGAPIQEPTQGEAPLVPLTSPFHEADLHALEDASAPGIHLPGAADHNITLEFGLDVANLVFTVNGTTFHPPSVPILLQILSGAHTAEELLPSELVHVLGRNKVVELTMLPMELAGPHPMHLHGHAFHVVKSAGSDTYNYVNPVRRDTVELGSKPGDNVVIRFRTDNPGPWFLHCHIDWHLKLGFAAVFAESPAAITEAHNAPSAWDNLCPAYEAAQQQRVATPGSLKITTANRLLPIRID